MSARPYRAIHAMTASVAALEKHGHADLADDLWRACSHVSSLVGAAHGLTLREGVGSLPDSTKAIIREAVDNVRLNP